MKHTALMIAACIYGTAALAQPAPPLMTKDLIGDPTREVRILTVTSPPGGSAPVHRHNGQVFVYMLSGSMVMQVKGKPAVTLVAGQTFYEDPDDVHTVSRNASQTDPAKFLVVMILHKGAPTTVAGE